MLMKPLGPLGCESNRKSIKEKRQTSQGSKYGGVEDAMEPVGAVGPDGRKGGKPFPHTLGHTMVINLANPFLQV